jgi:hypothetical protein
MSWEVVLAAMLFIVPAELLVLFTNVLVALSFWLVEIFNTRKPNLVANCEVASTFPDSP